MLFTIIFHLLAPDTAWRTMFFLGILPALLVLFVRRHIAEPEIYTAARGAARPGDSPRISGIFRGKLLPRTVLAWAMSLGTLGGNFTVLTWLPTYLLNERHLSYSNTGLYLLVNIVGSFIGYNVGGLVSDRLGPSFPCFWGCLRRSPALPAPSASQPPVLTRWSWFAALRCRRRAPPSSAILALNNSPDTVVDNCRS